MVPLDVKTGVSVEVCCLDVCEFLQLTLLLSVFLCQLMIASMFRFVEDDADGLSLDDDLNKFLTKARK